jgi:hypothetical protein
VTLLKEPMFWISVVIVAVVVNWLWQRFMPGKGKLV